MRNSKIFRKSTSKISGCMENGRSNARKEYLEKIEHNLRACQVSIDSLNFGKITNITNLGSTVNTIHDEYFPFVSNDQKMLFYTLQKKNESNEDLYYSTANNAGRWRNRSPFKYFNTPADEADSRWCETARGCTSRLVNGKG